MAQNPSKRKTRCLDEITRLKGRRRVAVIKCAAALAGVIVLVAGKQLLAAQGVIDPNGIAAGGATMLCAFGLAIVGGTSSIDFTKSGKKIAEIRRSCIVTDEEIRSHRIR